MSLQSRFEELLSKLNPAQVKAVESIDGPVWVLAGPGTGKTHILAARIGQILTQTDTQPYNVLCLTFTDAGVQAMRERLLTFIGAAAHQVHIYTFHSFCNKIIQENLYIFGKRELEPVSELERLEIAQDLLDKLPLSHPLKSGRNNPHFFAPHLVDLFKTIKREGWTVDQVTKATQDHSDNLPNLPEYQYQRKYKQFQKGDPKEASIISKRDRLERFRSAALLYDDYQKRLSEKGRYDYEDMILWVLEAFDNYPMLLRRYQEQYLYVLADEYQDTNGAQNAVLMKLISYWDNPNVFIVGDDDQAVYEFQGAKLENVFNFYKDFESSLLTVVLQENYRSTQGILDQSATLIGHNQLRASNLDDSLNKQLTASHPDRKGQDAGINFLSFDNRLQEITYVLSRIQELHAEGIPYNEMAVIYAKHKQAATLLELLDKSKLPYFTKREINILELPIIRQLTDILRYISLESKSPYAAEHLLVRMLHNEFTQIALSDIAAIGLHLSRSNELHWRDAIIDKQLPDGLKSRAAILRFGSFLSTVLRQEDALSLPLFIERVLTRSGLLQYVYTQPNYEEDLEALTTFTQFVQSEVVKMPKLNLSALIRLIERMDSNHISLPLLRSSRTYKGVQLLTAHAAKGLEFEHVFIIDAVSDQWEPGNRRGNRQFSLPDTLSLSSESEDALEARRRLFYVAMTRAKSGLSISFSKKNERNKPLLQTRFIDEIIEDSDYSIVHRDVSKDKLITAQKLLLSERENRSFELIIDREAIEEKLSDFKLSISALNTYLECPLTFYYEYVLSVPVVTSEKAAYGMAIHASMEVFFKQNKKKAKKPTVRDLISAFEKELSRKRPFFDANSYSHYLEMGKQNLGIFHKQHLKDIPEESLLEYRISQVEYRGVPLVGSIDRIDVLPQSGAHLVDYKTGKLRREKLRRPSSAHPQGGSYWRQLVFYKILFESWPRYDLIARSAALLSTDQLEDGKLASETYQLTAKDTAVVGELIESAYTSIKKQQFTDGCGKPDCVWCNLLGIEELPLSLENSDTIELDD